MCIRDSHLGELAPREYSEFFDYVARGRIATDLRCSNTLLNTNNGGSTECHRVGNGEDRRDCRDRAACFAHRDAQAQAQSLSIEERLAEYDIPSSVWNHAAPLLFCLSGAIAEKDADRSCGFNPICHLDNFFDSTVNSFFDFVIDNSGTIISIAALAADLAGCGGVCSGFLNGAMAVQNGGDLGDFALAVGTSVLGGQVLQLGQIGNVPLTIGVTTNGVELCAVGLVCGEQQFDGDTCASVGSGLSVEVCSNETVTVAGNGNNSSFSVTQDLETETTNFNVNFDVTDNLSVNASGSNDQNGFELSGGASLSQSRVDENGEIDSNGVFVNLNGSGVVEVGVSNEGGQAGINNDGDIRIDDGFVAEALVDGLRDLNTSMDGTDEPSTCPGQGAGAQPASGHLISRNELSLIGLSSIRNVQRIEPGVNGDLCPTALGGTTPLSAGPPANPEDVNAFVEGFNNRFANLGIDFPEDLQLTEMELARLNSLLTIVSDDELPGGQKLTAGRELQQLLGTAGVEDFQDTDSDGILNYQDDFNSQIYNAPNYLDPEDEEEIRSITILISNEDGHNGTGSIVHLGNGQYGILTNAHVADIFSEDELPTLENGNGEALEAVGYLGGIDNNTHPDPDLTNASVDVAIFEIDPSSLTPEMLSNAVELSDFERNPEAFSTLTSGYPGIANGELVFIEGVSVYQPEINSDNEPTTAINTAGTRIQEGIDVSYGGSSGSIVRGFDRHGNPLGPIGLNYAGSPHPETGQPQGSFIIPENIHFAADQILGMDPDGDGLPTQFDLQPSVPSADNPIQLNNPENNSGFEPTPGEPELSVSTFESTLENETALLVLVSDSCQRGSSSAVCNQIREIPNTNGDEEYSLERTRQIICTNHPQNPICN